MKLTIEIPDAHTGAILEFVSALVAKSLPVEESTDPAPGHPELPLMVGTPDDEGDLRLGVVGELDDTPNTDTDFVGHGHRKLQPGETIEDSDEYFNPTEGVWKLTGCAGEAICYGYGENNESHLLHRRKVRVPQPTAGLSPEAAKAIQAATDEANPLRVAMDDPIEDTRPRLIPEPGNHYFLRNGKAARIDGESEWTIDGAVHIGGGQWGGFYWRKDGEPCGSVGPEWDCVEVTPF